MSEIFNDLEHVEDLAMAGEIITVNLGQEPPESWDACILVGGYAARRTPSAKTWQAQVVALLRERWTGDGQVVVFTPDLESGAQNEHSGKLIDWYDRAFNMADVVMFWWPDETDSSLVSTSLIAWNDSQRMIHGAPSQAPHSPLLIEYANRHAMSSATTLDDMVSAALAKIGSGARRVAVEREIPLPLWRAVSFQQWYSAQTSAGNTLLDARPVWTFGVGPSKRLLLYWALHVHIYIRTEDRVKSNEVVISRPDISVLALYQRGPTIGDTTIVLVREFRSPASTPDGLVHELPGGAGAADLEALSEAIRETEEETGLAIDSHRIQTYGSRQLAATVSAHHAHLFAAEITADELAWLRSTLTTPHGAGDSEQTWTEITTFDEIRESRLVDWATLGMIAEAVLDRPALSSRHNG